MRGTSVGGEETPPFVCRGLETGEVAQERTLLSQLSAGLALAKLLNTRVLPSGQFLKQAKPLTLERLGFDGGADYSQYPEGRWMQKMPARGWEKVMTQCWGREGFSLPCPSRAAWAFTTGTVFLGIRFGSNKTVVGSGDAFGLPSLLVVTSKE